MSDKSKIKRALEISWKCIKFPFQVLHFIWKHKVLSLLTAIGVWWGTGKLKVATYGDSCPRGPRITQRAPQKQVKKTPTKEQIAALESAATQAVEKKSLVSSALGDAANRDGPRALPAKDRITAFVEQGSKTSSYPDRKGLHTIVICDQTNVQNYAALHIGFHHDGQKGIGKFLLYRSCIKPENGSIPKVAGPFNISFDVPGIRMGVEVEKDNIFLIKCQDSATTIPVSKDNGKTLLVTTPDGGLSHITDTNVIEQVFAQLPINQKAGVKKHDFVAYHDKGAYSTITPTRQMNLRPEGKDR